MKVFKWGFHNALVPRYVNYYFWQWFDNCFAFFYHLIKKDEIENVRLNVKNLKWKPMHHVASRRIDKRAIGFINSL